MGWSSNKKHPGESNLRFLRRTSGYFVGSKWPGQTPEKEYQVVALQVGRGGAYGVLRLTDSLANTEYLFATVIKIETLAGSTMFKSMSEVDGPDLADMPEKLLRRLTPADQLPFDAEDIARCKDWRARCQKLIDNKAALRPGVRITVPLGIPFGFGARVTEFAVASGLRMFVANPGSPGQFRCQLSHFCLDNLEFAVHS